LENFLLDESRTTIKICDFDQCGFIKPNKMFKETRGSLAYSSPAIVMKVPYKGEEEDVWSIGICLYAMLTGLVLNVFRSRGTSGLTPYNIRPFSFL
jgi:serine/threonine protein kinase